MIYKKLQKQSAPLVSSAFWRELEASPDVGDRKEVEKARKAVFVQVQR